MWTKSLALSLGLLAGGARAEETVWRSQAVAPAAATEPAAVLGKPIAIATSVRQALENAPAASIGRPVPLATSLSKQMTIQPVAYSSSNPLAPVVRGQAPEVIPVKPTPIGPSEAGTPAPMPTGPVQFGWRRPDDVVASSRPDGIVSVPPPGAVSPIVPMPGEPSVPSLFATGSCPACGTHAGECASCGTAGCGNCCPPPPRFWVSAEYLLWRLKGDNTPPLVTTGNPAIDGSNASIIGFPSTRVVFGGTAEGTHPFSGVRLNAGYWFGENGCLGIDVSAFTLNQTQHFSLTSFGDPQIGRPFIDQAPFARNPMVGGVMANPRFGTPNVQFVAQLNREAGTVDVSRPSSFWGGEVNLRKNCLCGPNGYIDLLVGYRMLGLDESLTITENLVSLAGDASRFFVRDHFGAQNRFYGGQVGGVGEYRLGNWTFGARLEVALGNSQQMVNIDGFGVDSHGGLLARDTNSGHFVKNAFAVVPELGLTLGYQCTDHWRVFGGYNFLYWSRVARPGEQIDLNVNRSPELGGPRAPVFTMHSSDFWAQGLTVGLEYSY
jgi:hypothetical protein